MPLSVYLAKMKWIRNPSSPPPPPPSTSPSLHSVSSCFDTHFIIVASSSQKWFVRWKFHSKVAFSLRNATHKLFCTCPIWCLVRLEFVLMAFLVHWNISSCFLHPPNLYPHIWCVSEWSCVCAAPANGFQSVCILCCEIEYRDISTSKVHRKWYTLLQFQQNDSFSRETWENRSREKNRNHWDRIVDSILYVCVCVFGFLFHVLETEQLHAITWKFNMMAFRPALSAPHRPLQPPLAIVKWCFTLRSILPTGEFTSHAKGFSSRYGMRMENKPSRTTRVCKLWNSASPLLWCIKMAKSNWNYVVMDNWNMNSIGFIPFSALISHITSHKTYEPNYFSKLQLFLLAKWKQTNRNNNVLCTSSSVK